ncbi:MAG TPA: HPF/RaiA family ribosome-associated protein [Kribbella sp.]|nr:HPF/RaiA family ribosome-associated protein [Kribbella sp.]
MTNHVTNIPIQLTVRGAVPDEATSYALRKTEHVLSRTHAPVLHAHLAMVLEPNPAQERPARIEVGALVGGTPVRAHVSAEDLTKAADLVADRLKRRLHQLRERTRTRHRWIGVPEQHEWRHGDLPPRPVAEVAEDAGSRPVVKHKTFALEPMTPDEAAYEMDLLDHAFYLFIDRDTGGDALVYRRDDGSYRLLGRTGGTAGLERPDEPPPTISLAQAKERLDVTGDRFVFYLDPTAGRGHVLYRRYDGGYGLIVAS